MVAEWISAIANVVLAGVAVYAAANWKQDVLAKRKFELAETFLTQIYDARTNIVRISSFLEFVVLNTKEPIDKGDRIDFEATKQYNLNMRKWGKDDLVSIDHIFNSMKTNESLVTIFFGTQGLNLYKRAGSEFDTLSFNYNAFVRTGGSFPHFIIDSEGIEKRMGKIAEDAKALFGDELSQDNNRPFVSLREIWSGSIDGLRRWLTSRF